MSYWLMEEQTRAQKNFKVQIEEAKIQSKYQNGVRKRELLIFHNAEPGNVLN